MMASSVGRDILSNSGSGRNGRENAGINDGSFREGMDDRFWRRKCAYERKFWVELDCSVKVELDADGRLESLLSGG